MLDGALHWQRVTSVCARTVLETGTKSLCLELLSRRTNSDRSPIGLIDLELEIAPSPRPGATGAPLIDPSIIDKQIALEQSTTSANRRRFHSYAKSWWNDYLQIRPDHLQRVIKMFACNEDDERVFVCTFLRPIHCSRILPTALHAARFVRLIPFVPDVDVGGERTNVWNSLHVFLSRGYGDVEDHCALLCSLLLGFGLDAYVVCGKVLHIVFVVDGIRSESVALVEARWSAYVGDDEGVENAGHVLGQLHRAYVCC